MRQRLHQCPDMRCGTSGPGRRSSSGATAASSMALPILQGPQPGQPPRKAQGQQCFSHLNLRWNHLQD